MVAYGTEDAIRNFVQALVQRGKLTIAIEYVREAPDRFTEAQAKAETTVDSRGGG